MANITYTPNFVAPVYRDNVDLVSAESANGFNAQFRALRAEFDQLTQVISQINTSLQAVGHSPAVQTSKTLMPSLVATSTNGWNQHPGFVEKAAQQTSAQGVMTLDLPNGVTINKFRATGRNGNVSGGPGSGTLPILLQRQKVDLTLTTDNIATLAPGTDPFDVSGPADPKFAVVDTSQFKYFIFVELDGANQNDIVTINAFQVIYTMPAS